MSRTALAFALVALSFPMSSLAGEAHGPLLQTAIAIEQELDARLGLAIYDHETNQSWLYNENERFPMASTFKILACAALLASGEAVPTQPVTIAADELVSYSPVTEKLVGQSVSVLELCEATMHTSDNTAANKVLDVLGGPPAVTSYLRAIGDRMTRLDRREPDLNEGRPGDERDTTTPAAMASTLEQLVLGDTLNRPARDQLTSWLTGNQVGGPLLRSGVPTDWRIADRTGAGGYGTRGIVAVMWPPGRKPIVAAIYLTETEAGMDQRNAAIAKLGKALAQEVSP